MIDKVLTDLILSENNALLATVFRNLQVDNSKIFIPFNYFLRWIDNVPSELLTHFVITVIIDHIT